MANNLSGQPTVKPQDTIKIMQRMWSPELKDDPYAWAMYAFPWEQPNTPLARYKGPRNWQKDILNRMTDHIGENYLRLAKGDDPEVFQCAIASGRGPGKSAILAIIDLWFMSCVYGGTAIISANTDIQLTSKTFGEIGKWRSMCLSGYWFEPTQKKLTPYEWYANQLEQHRKIDRKLYYTEGVLWNEDNPDSFAGAHNDIGMLLIFDEASGIPKPIWTTSEGFFSEKTIYRFWFAFGNPRRNTGAFFECFHAHRNYWYNKKIDSRTVEGLDQKVFNNIIEKYGIDSDEAKVEVLGEFPSRGDNQFIDRGVVEAAQKRELERYDDHAALVMGVDPARFGDDSTVICFRRGRDARSIPPTIMKGADNMKVANQVAHLIDIHQPDAVFIDSGAGAGIIDRLKEQGYKVIEVGFGTAAVETPWADHRTELWGRMRDWLQGAMIDTSERLKDDLCGPEYEFVGRDDRIKLEAKEKMKKRGLSSPDRGDSLAITFHAKVARRDLRASRFGMKRQRVAKGVDYQIFKPLGD